MAAEGSSQSSSSGERPHSKSSVFKSLMVLSGLIANPTEVFVEAKYSSTEIGLISEKT